MTDQDEYRKHANNLAECHRQAIKAGDSELARILASRLNALCERENREANKN
jgi:hypothetical protein